jgi:hypothetical protein
MIVVPYIFLGELWSPNKGKTYVVKPNPTLFEKHDISTHVEHIKKPLTQTNKILVHHCIIELKPSKRGIVHNTSQCNHLRKYINAKESDFAYEFLTIYHQQLTLHAL